MDWYALQGDGRSPSCPILDCCRRPLGGEAFGREWLVGLRFLGISRRRGSFLLDLGGDAAATSVVEVHKWKTGPGHRLLQERDRRCRRQAMLAAQVQKSADKAVAAVCVVIAAARPVAVVGKKLEH